MKRFAALLLCLMMVLSLAACGSQEPPSATGGQTALVERENGQVIFTMSPNMLEIIGTTADAMVAASDESDQIVKNDDGSVSCKMTEEGYSQMLASLRQMIDESIEAVKSDEKQDCIKDITRNDDVTEIVISVDKEAFEADVEASMIAPTFGVSGMIYQMYRGIPDDVMRCAVLVKDADSGEEIESLVYPDILEETTSE